MAANAGLRLDYSYCESSFLSGGSASTWYHKVNSGCWAERSATRAGVSQYKELQKIGRCTSDDRREPRMDVPLDHRQKLWKCRFHTRDKCRGDLWQTWHKFYQHCGAGQLPGAFALSCPGIVLPLVDTNSENVKKIQRNCFNYSTILHSSMSISSTRALMAHRNIWAAKPMVWLWIYNNNMPLYWPDDRTLHCNKWDKAARFTQVSHI